GFVAATVANGMLDLTGIVVEPGSRRLGLGRALLRHAIAVGKRRRLDAAVLHVSIANGAAIALYESEGFAASRRIPSYYAGSLGEGNDAIRMVRALRRTAG